MKFFKHFTDAHRGKSLQQLLRSKNKEIGLKAIGIYWVLVELCAEKMTKEKTEEYGDQHCHFEFNTGYIRDTLGLHQTSTLAMYLRWYSDVGVMSAQCSNDVTSIYMPKLLECIDRDSKRARTERGATAPKIKNKDKDKEIDIPKPKFDFEEIYNRYPRKLKKTEGIARLESMILTDADYQLLLLAVDAYCAYLKKEKTEAKFIAHFTSFIGTKKKQAWRDWLAADAGSIKKPVVAKIHVAPPKPDENFIGELTPEEQAERLRIVSSSQIKFGGGS